MNWSVPFFLGLFALAGSPARAAGCETGELGALVRQGKDLYLGEVHGTTEIPALVRCLVEVASSNEAGKLIVSLEQQPASARAPQHPPPSTTRSAAWLYRWRTCSRISGPATGSCVRFAIVCGPPKLIVIDVFSEKPIGVLESIIALY